MVLYDLQHAGYGLCKSTALGFTSKGIKTSNVHGCELACKSWEGVNDFRLYNGLINNAQAIKCKSLIFLTVTVEIGVDYHVRRWLT